MTHDLPFPDSAALAEKARTDQPPRTGVIRKPFFYDRQIKRLLVQLLACFSGYQVVTGNQRDGTKRFMDVPIIYGDMSRVAGYIMHGGSENVMSYVPIMSLYMTGIRQKAEWRQSPQHYEKFNFIERARDPDGNLLVNVPGKKKTVERYQPVPYDVDLSLAMWASNNDQGYQIVEQICTVFNPDMDIQLSNSPADWTFLTSLIFQGDVQIEKAVPGGTDVDPLYVFTFPFQTVLWMSPPAKVYDTKYIYEIKVPIKEIEENLDFDSFETIDGLIIKADEEDVMTFESFT